MSMFKRLLADRKGAAAIEYGLGLAMLAVASITVWGAVGSQAEPPGTSVNAAVRDA